MCFFTPSSVQRKQNPNPLRSDFDPNPFGYNRYMTPTPEAQRLHTAFDLFEAGIRMMAARYRRNHPDASPAEIEAMLSEWLLQRPGAQFGDADGRPVTWPRVS